MRPARAPALADPWSASATRPSSGPWRSLRAAAAGRQQSAAGLRAVPACRRSGPSASAHLPPQPRQRPP
eukprot:15103853-Alexandrium_andersonii.AAC.1